MHDVIVKMGSRTIVDSDSLIAAVHAAVPNSVVAVTYLRGGEHRTVRVTLGSSSSS